MRSVTRTEVSSDLTHDRGLDFPAVLGEVGVARPGGAEIDRDADLDRG